MADAVASALNVFMRDTVQLSPRDEEAMQSFIAEFFTSSADSDNKLSGIIKMNY